MLITLGLMPPISWSPLGGETEPHLARLHIIGYK